MATPFISGVFALMKSVKPSATLSQLTNCLYTTALTLNFQNRVNGNKSANAMAAVACAKSLP